MLFEVNTERSLVDILTTKYPDVWDEIKNKINPMSHQEAQIIEEILPFAEDRAIRAIKAIRNITGASLREAKEYLDRICPNTHIDGYSPMRKFDISTLVRFDAYKLENPERFI